jgi:FkbM family methyltransferase
MSLVFDIGANIGNWTKSNLHTYDKIISIEASEKTFKKLQKNCNNSKIVALNYAVCNNNCNDILFYEAQNDTLSTINKEWLTSSSSRFFNTPYKEIVCKTITIDKLINEYGKPDLIKIDVECGEFECISSLSQKVNLLCFEWASETNNITFNCLEYLSKIGFTEYYIQDRDDYTFVPSFFYSKEDCINKLLRTVAKKDFGMIWCR